MENLFAGLSALPGAFAQGMNIGAYQQTRRDMLEQRRQEAANAQRMREAELAGRFGAYAVTGPDGRIDMQASARAMQAAQQAAQLGEAEALSGQSFADVDQAIRQMPEYRVGFAKGAASEAAQQRRFDALMDVQGARGKTAEEVARIRADTAAEIQALREGAKTKEATAKVTRKVGDTEATYEVPVENLQSILGGGGAQVSGAVRQRLADLQDAKEQIRLMPGNVVDFEFSGTGEPKVKKAGIVFGRTPKAEALRQIEAEIERITGGEPGGGMPSVPRGTNRELPGVTMGTESIRDILGSVRTNAPASGRTYGYIGGELVEIKPRTNP